MQWRVRDFAMERCILVGNLPLQSDDFDPATRFTSGSLIDLWLLDGSHELLPSISWGTAPPRQQRLTTFAFDANGTFASKEFNCSSGSFVTVEFACSHDQKPCHADFWQHPDVPKSGLSVIDDRNAAASYIILGVYVLQMQSFRS